MIDDPYPIPNRDDIFDHLGGARFFSSLDLASGCHQIPVAEKDQPKTAFTIPSGHFEFTRMPYGLKNASRAFQRIVNNCLQGLIGTACFIYIDDIVIFSSTLEEHLKKLN